MVYRKIILDTRVISQLSNIAIDDLRVLCPGVLSFGSNSSNSSNTGISSTSLQSIQSLQSNLSSQYSSSQQSSKSTSYHTSTQQGSTYGYSTDYFSIVKILSSKSYHEWVEFDWPKDSEFNFSRVYGYKLKSDEYGWYDIESSDGRAYGHVYVYSGIIIAYDYSEFNCKDTLKYISDIYSYIIRLNKLAKELYLRVMSLEERLNEIESIYRQDTRSINSNRV